MAERSASLCVRASAKTRNPSAASLLAIANPTPREPPETSTLRLSMTGQLSSGGQFQLFDKTNHGGHLEGGQLLPAMRQQSVPDAIVGGAAQTRIQHHFRHHNRAG